ncbi:MAG: LpxI family protein [Bosea sp. (in: a-proteobacteria)]
MTTRTPFSVAIIAGSGTLPLHVATSARASGAEVFVAALAGSARCEDFTGFACEAFGLGQLGGLFKALHRRGITHAAFIGGVMRPGFKDIKPDFGLLKHLGAMPTAFKKGDDGLLTAIIGVIEAEGITVISALEIAPDLALNSPGVITKARPTHDAEHEITLGLKLIATLSEFDVGQCVVVSDGRPVAIEGAEGTDAMLVRVRDMRTNGRLRRETGGGVLVKTPKRGQNMRVDIPTIGPATVRHAAEAGLQGIAVAVGTVLLAERAETVKLADELGLFIEARA